MTNAQTMLVAAAIVLAGAVIAIAIGIQAMGSSPSNSLAGAPIPGVVAAIAAVVLGMFALNQMKEAPRA